MSIAPTTTPTPTTAEINKLTRAIKNNEPGALPKLCSWLRDSTMVDRLHGNLCHLIECRIVGQMTSLSKVQGYAILHQAKLVRQSLANADEPALIQLLAERAALCWLQVHVLEYIASTIDSEGVMLLQRLTDQAHRRYLSAMSTLAAVRKMNIPSIQVNVAQQQVVVGSMKMQDRRRGKRRTKMQIVEQ